MARQSLRPRDLAAAPHGLHVVHGFGFYLLLWLVAPRMPSVCRLVIAVGLETSWEIVENTPFIMDRYRQSALARGYFRSSHNGGEFFPISAVSAIANALRGCAQSTSQLYMARARMLINVLFLGVVYPHQGLNRLDHTLRISNQISVGLLGSEAILKLAQEAC